MRRSLVPAQPPAIVVQPAAQPVPLPAPQSQPDAEAQAEITRQIEALKLELEKSRAEMEALKARTAAKPAVPAPSSKPQPCPCSTWWRTRRLLLATAARVEVYRASSILREGDKRPSDFFKTSFMKENFTNPP